jgi:hypothetical protein
VESEKDKQENAQPPAETAQAAPESTGAASDAAAPDAQAASSETPAAPPAGDAAPSGGLSPLRVFAVFGGVTALLIIGAVVAMRGTPQDQSKPGSTIAADITLVTSDAKDLDCAAAAAIEKYRCAFSDDTTPSNVEEKDKLRPYKTTEGHSYLIPGLFLQPAVEARLRSEPPDKPRDLLKRFTAKCTLKILGKVGGVKTRYLASSAWGPAEEVEAAVASDCKVEG